MRSFLFGLALVAGVAVAQADIITQWAFNDTNAPASAPPPHLGEGTASLVGNGAGGYVSGASADHTSTTNKAWNTKNYPPVDVSNKLAGVQFNVSTLGYQNIALSWYQENSSTASRFARLQYALDGATFTDAEVITISTTSFTNQVADLSGIDGATNNPLFAFRIVTEFELTATGEGFPGYKPTSGVNYSTSGTIHFDLVTVSGTLFPGTNDRPTISAISNQTVRVNRSTAALPFTVLDAEDPADSLTLAKASSNPAAVPVTNIVFGGTGSHRTVTVTGGSEGGVSLVTIRVLDNGGASNSTSFTVTVLPANTAPFISDISPTNTVLNLPAPPMNFTVSDAETPAGSLTLAGTSANPALVPNGNILFGGSGSNRTVTVTPAAGQAGVAPISATASDGTNTATSLFAVMVTPSSNVLFFEPFTYTDGSLLTNSGFLWDHRSGTTVGECQVTNGQLQVTATQGEDVSGTLVGGPYVKNSNTVLYAAFKAKFLTLPKATPDYFAHFGSTHRGRIYAGAPTNSAPGWLRLYVSNATDTNAVLVGEISTNVACSVVLRYNIDSATATLWLNPVSEAGPGATAIDTTNAVSISTFGFRQDSGCGATLLVDDLKVGLSFAAVTVTNPVLVPIPLTAQRRGTNLVLNWSNPAFGLQSGPAATGLFTNVPNAVSPYTNRITGARRFFRLRAN